jgi:hypothetical protein
MRTSFSALYSSRISRLSIFPPVLRGNSIDDDVENLLKARAGAGLGCCSRPS